MPSYPSSKTSFTLPTGESGKRESQKQSMKSLVCHKTKHEELCLFVTLAPAALSLSTTSRTRQYAASRPGSVLCGTCLSLCAWCLQLPPPSFFFNLGLTVPPFLWFQQELLRRRSHPEPKNNLIKYLKEELREGKKTKQSLFSGRPYGMRGTLEAQLSQH